MKNTITKYFWKHAFIAKTIILFAVYSQAFGQQQLPEKIRQAVNDTTYLCKNLERNEDSNLGGYFDLSCVPLSQEEPLFQSKRLLNQKNFPKTHFLVSLESPNQESSLCIDEKYSNLNVAIDGVYIDFKIIDSQLALDQPTNLPDQLTKELPKELLEECEQK